jgi:hypothetical protein
VTGAPRPSAPRRDCVRAGEPARLVSRVPDGAITIRVIRPGARTDELLAALEKRFGSDRVWRDDYGAVHVGMSGRRAAAWDKLRDALDAAGSDWRQWLHLAPRPSGWRA